MGGKRSVRGGNERLFFFLRMGMGMRMGRLRWRMEDGDGYDQTGRDEAREER